MATTTVHVTQEMIDKGIRASCVQCPVALALNAAFPGKRFMVGPSDICSYDYSGIGPGPKSHDMPKWLRVFIDLYDNEQTVAPFSFEFEL